MAWTRSVSTIWYKPKNQPDIGSFRLRLDEQISVSHYLGLLVKTEDGLFIGWEILLGIDKLNGTLIIEVL